MHGDHIGLAARIQCGLRRRRSRARIVEALLSTLHGELVLVQSSLHLSPVAIECLRLALKHLLGVGQRGLVGLEGRLRLVLSCGE